MTFNQRKDEHMYKILFHSLINEGTSKVFQLFFQRRTQVLHIYGLIRNLRKEFTNGYKTGRKGQYPESGTICIPLDTTYISTKEIICITISSLQDNFYLCRVVNRYTHLWNLMILDSPLKRYPVISFSHFKIPHNFPLQHFLSL